MISRMKNAHAPERGWRALAASILAWPVCAFCVCPAILKASCDPATDSRLLCRLERPGPHFDIQANVRRFQDLTIKRVLYRYCANRSAMLFAEPPVRDDQIPAAQGRSASLIGALASHSKGPVGHDAELPAKPIRGARLVRDSLASLELRRWGGAEWVAQRSAPCTLGCGGGLPTERAALCATTDCTNRGCLSSLAVLEPSRRLAVLGCLTERCPFPDLRRQPGVHPACSSQSGRTRRRVPRAVSETSSNRIPSSPA
jgi:hypothetical protein